MLKIVKRFVKQAKTKLNKLFVKIAVQVKLGTAHTMWDPRKRNAPLHGILLQPGHQYRRNSFG